MEVHTWNAFVYGSEKPFRRPKRRHGMTVAQGHSYTHIFAQFMRCSSKARASFIHSGIFRAFFLLPILVHLMRNAPLFSPRKTIARCEHRAVIKYAAASRDVLAGKWTKQCMKMTRIKFKLCDGFRFPLSTSQYIYTLPLFWRLTKVMGSVFLSFFF